MTFTVYILRSLRDKHRYTGMTKDIDRRLDEHRRGMVKSTRNRRPMELIYTEQYDLKAEAMKREKFLKSGQGRAFLDTL